MESKHGIPVTSEQVPRCWLTRAGSDLDGLKSQTDVPCPIAEVKEDRTVPVHRGATQPLSNNRPGASNRVVMKTVRSDRGKPRKNVVWSVTGFNGTMAEATDGCSLVRTGGRNA